MEPVGVSLELKGLTLDGVEAELFVCVVQGQEELARAPLRWAGGHFHLSHLVAFGLDDSEAATLEVRVMRGLSGDSLLGELPLESRGPFSRKHVAETIGNMGAAIAFDYSVVLSAGSGGTDVEASLVQAILKPSGSGVQFGAEPEQDGKLLFLSQNEYDGHLVSAAMSGRGVYRWHENIVFEGGFEESIPSGQGEFVWPDGSHFRGSVVNGKRDGIGVFTGTDGTKYEGMWLGGVRHGTGKLELGSEAGKYFGQWAEHLKSGQGTMTYATGNSYAGEWAEGVRHGEGTMEWRDSGERYAGTWADGLPHGRGEHVWLFPRDASETFQTRERYSGQFERGQREGWGTFHFANGSVYSGMWERNQKHGQGTFTFEDGSVFEGSFVHDRMADGNLRANIDMRDVCGDAVDDALLRSVQNVLLQHVGSTKETYRRYAQLGFRQFARDLQACSPDLSLAQIERAVASAAGVAPAELAGEGPLLAAVRLRAQLRSGKLSSGGLPAQQPLRTISQRAFTKCLVALAALVQPTSEQPRSDGLVEQLRAFMTGRVLPLTSRAASPLGMSEEELDGSRDSELRLVFALYAGDADALRCSRRPPSDSLRVRCLVKLLDDAAVPLGRPGLVDGLLAVLPESYCAKLAAALSGIRAAAEEAAGQAAAADGENSAAEGGAAEAGAADAASEEAGEAGAEDEVGGAPEVLDALGELLEVELTFDEFKQALAALARNPPPAPAEASAEEVAAAEEKAAEAVAAEAAAAEAAAEEEEEAADEEAADEATGEDVFERLHGCILDGVTSLVDREIVRLMDMPRAWYAHATTE